MKKIKVRPGILVTLVMAFTITSLAPLQPATAQASGNSQVGASTVEFAGRLRMLGARANKEYLVYQFRIEGQTSKEPLLETVQVFDQAISMLNQGSEFAQVAAPPNDAVRAALAEVAAVWKDLRRVYTYNSIQVRRAKDLMSQPERLADPYLVTFVDRNSNSLLKAADALVEAYEAACAGQRGSCGNNIGLAAGQRALSEAITSDILFVALGIDEKGHQASLSDRRQQFSGALDTLRAGNYQRTSVADSLERITAYWTQLENIANIAIGGDVDAIDVGYLLRTQDRLVDELEGSLAMFAMPPSPDAGE